MIKFHIWSTNKSRLTKTIGWSSIFDLLIHLDRQQYCFDFQFFKEVHDRKLPKIFVDHQGHVYTPENFPMKERQYSLTKKKEGKIKKKNFKCKI